MLNLREKEMLKAMFKEQDALNQQLSSYWYKEPKFNYPRAIVMELAELIDCFNWEWWKNKDVNTKNIIIEVVDVWHFLISWLLQQEYYFANKSLDLIAEQVHYFYDKVSYTTNPESEYYYEDVIQLAEEMMEYALSGDICRATKTFFSICFVLKIDLQYLFSIYLGKRVLNDFRWDCKKKYGFYDKYWCGTEDNFILLYCIDKIVSNFNFYDTSQLAHSVAEYLNKLHNALAIEYDKHLTRRAEDIKRRK